MCSFCDFMPSITLHYVVLVILIVLVHRLTSLMAVRVVTLLLPTHGSLLMEYLTTRAPTT